MNPKQTPRIVPKSRYLRYLSQKVGLFGSGTFLLVSGVLGIVVCGGLILGAIFPIVDTMRYGGSVQHNVLDGLSPIQMLMFCLVFIVWAVCISLHLARSGRHQMDKASQLERLAPLTRQTANQLSAEQSLVRASSEPSEMQQAVLLRAAGANAQTPPEELLRATTQEVRP